MLKIVINAGYGGFGLSPKAILFLIERNSPLIKSCTFDEWGYNQLPNETLEHIPISEDFFADDRQTVVNDKTRRVYYFEDDIIDRLTIRSHPDLINVVEQLGEEANGRCSTLKVIEIIDWDITLDKIEIEDYAGYEHIREKSRTWQ